MKKTIVIALTLLFMLHGSMRVIVIAFYQLNRAYISEHLCENKNKPELNCEGKCFLKKGLKKENQQTNILNQLLKEYKEVISDTKENCSLVLQENHLVQHHFSYIENIGLAIEADIFHPPCQSETNTQIT